MVVIVDSLTGISYRFAKKLNYNLIRLGVDELPDELGAFFLVTRTSGFGEIPESTVALLRKHYKKCIGVAVSGNRNWGTNYGAAGDKIQAIYHIPLVCKFEASGFPQDWELVNQYIKEKLKNE